MFRTIGQWKGNLTSKIQPVLQVVTSLLEMDATANTL